MAAVFADYGVYATINKMVHTDKRVNSLSDDMEPSKPPADPVSFLYDRHGRRKYLSIPERRACLAAGRQMPLKPRLFLETLAYSGARISEVLALLPESFDEAEGLVVIESLKKRRRGIFRAVPLPRSLIAEIMTITAPNGSGRSPDRVWNCSRTTAWNWVKRAMKAANISGPKASPKGLRHAFGVNSLQVVPITMVKKWLGHSRLSTTEIYAGAVGYEERAIASRIWKNF